MAYVNRSSCAAESVTRRPAGVGFTVPLPGWWGVARFEAGNRMSDPIYFVHALIVSTLVVIGLLMVVDAIHEGPGVDR
jgi:hypothetical protein